MSLTTNALITADDAQIVIGKAVQGSDLPLLEAAIEATSLLVRQKTNCLIVDVTTAFYDTKIDGSGRTFLYLPDWPVISVASLIEDDVTLVEGTDFRQVSPYVAAFGPLSMSRGILERINGRKWTRTPLGVVCTFTAGFLRAGSSASGIPGDLKLAVAIQAVDLWKKLKDQSWSKTSQTLGGQTVNFSDKELIPFVESTLKRYWREDYE